MNHYAKNLNVYLLNYTNVTEFLQKLEVSGSIMHTFYNTITLLHPKELTYELVKKRNLWIYISIKIRILLFEINSNNFLCDNVFQKNKIIRSISEKELLYVIFSSILCNQLDFSDLKKRKNENDLSLRHRLITRIIDWRNPYI